MRAHLALISPRVIVQVNFTSASAHGHRVSQRAADGRKQPCPIVRAERSHLSLGMEVRPVRDFLKIADADPSNLALVSDDRLENFILVPFQKPVEFFA